MTTLGPGAVVQRIEEELQTTSRVLGEVRSERRAQMVKWGTQEDPADTGDRPDGTGLLSDSACAAFAKQITDAKAEAGTLTWRDILDEEVREAFAETEDDKLRTELVQVAAVAVKWVEAIDRRAES